MRSCGCPPAARPRARTRAPHLGALVVRVDGLSADYVVDLRKDLVERLLHVGALQRARLDEREALLLAVALRLLRVDAAQVPQVGLVAHQHDDDVGVGMVAQLLQPALHVLKAHCGRAGDREQSAGSGSARTGAHAGPPAPACAVAQLPPPPPPLLLLQHRCDSSACVLLDPLLCAVAAAACQLTACAAAGMLLARRAASRPKHAAT
jgi:hypothetical protein